MTDPALPTVLPRDDNGHTSAFDVLAAQALARRAAELETVAKVSAATANILEPHRLLQEVVDLTKARFELYHAHIYLLNAAGDVLDLAAGAGEVGHKMVAQGWRIPLNREHSLVARAARNQHGLIVNDVRQNPDFLPNILLPETRAEMAVPMIVGEQLLGVLDVQSDQPGHFTDQDITIQTILATQVAVALQNARQHEQTQSALTESDRQRRTLQAILDNVPVGVFVTDAKTGMSQLVNVAALHLLGRGVNPHRTKEEATQVYPTYVPGTDMLLPVQDLPVVRTMSTGAIARGEVDIQHPEGRLTVEVLAAPIRDARGELASVVALYQDVTERRRHDRELRRSRERYELAVQGTNDGLWDWDMVSNQVYYSPRWKAMLGYTDAEIGSRFEEYESRIHPEDQPRVRKLLADYLAGAIPAYEAEIRMKHKDGAYRWILSRGKATWDNDGRPYRMAGSHTDMTERKQAEEELLKFRFGLERTTDAVFITDLDGRIVYVNPAFEGVYGYSPREAIGQTPRILKSGLIPPEGYKQFWDTLTAKQAVKGEIINKHKDGRLLNIEGANTPILDEAGQLLGYLAVHRDITERKRAEDTLLKRAAELEVVAQVGMAAVTIGDPVQLLQNVADLTQRSFKLYHTHIYMLTEAGDALELTASSGAVGLQLVAQGWRIPLHQAHSVVTQAARTRQSIILNDTQASADFLPNAQLPETRAEMAVPIMAGDTVLGVLDVQAAEVGRFTPDEARITATLAAQVAVALQNARQFAQTQRQAEREALVNTIGQQIQSATTVESALQIAARELGRALKAQRTTVQLSAARADKPHDPASSGHSG